MLTGQSERCLAYYACVADPAKVREDLEGSKAVGSR